MWKPWIYCKLKFRPKKFFWCKLCENLMIFEAKCALFFVQTSFWGFTEEWQSKTCRLLWPVSQLLVPQRFLWHSRFFVLLFSVHALSTSIARGIYLLVCFCFFSVPSVASLSCASWFFDFYTSVVQNIYVVFKATITSILLNSMLQIEKKYDIHVT